MTEAVCDANCLATQKQTAVTNSGDIIVTDPTTGQTTTYSATSIPNYLSATAASGATSGTDTPAGGRRLLSNDLRWSFNAPKSKHSPTMRRLLQTSPTPAPTATTTTASLMIVECQDNGAFLGVYNPSTPYIADLVTGRVGNSTALGIPNPLICLTIGQAILWYFRGGADSYPTYAKDDLLNNNLLFDYGSFRMAALNVKNINGTVFSFAFSQSGTHVFYNNKNVAQKTVVAVMEQGQTCPTSTVILPMTTTNLVQLKVSQRGGMTLEPDWLILGIIIGSLLLGVLLLIACVTFLQARGWGVARYEEPEYRAIGKKRDLDKYALKGTHDIKMIKMDEDDDGAPLTSEEAWEDGPWYRDEKLTLEGFSVRTLYDKLEDQTIHMGVHLQKHERDLVNHYHDLSKQSATLKALLVALIERCIAKDGGADDLLASALKDLKDTDNNALVEGGAEDGIQDGELAALADFVRKPPPTGVSMDDNVAKILAGLLGMAGGAAMGADGKVSGGGFGDAEGGVKNAPKLSDEDVKELSKRYDDDREIFEGALNHNDEALFEEVHEIRQQVTDIVKKSTNNGEDFDPTKLLDDLDRSEARLNKELEDEAERQKKALQDRLKKRRKAKEGKLEKQQLLESNEFNAAKAGEKELEEDTKDHEETIVDSIDRNTTVVEDVLYKAASNIENADDDDDAVRRALEEFEKSVAELEKKSKEDLEREKARLKAKLAARRKKGKQDLNESHAEEKEQIGNDDPAIVEQMLLKQRKENELEEAEMISYENEIKGQIDALEKMNDEMVTTLQKVAVDTEDIHDPSGILKAFDEANSKLVESQQAEKQKQREALRRKLEAQKKRRKQQREELKQEVAEAVDERHQREKEQLEETLESAEELSKAAEKTMEEHIAATQEQVSTTIDKVKEEAALGGDPAQLLRDLATEEKKLKRQLDADATKKKAELAEMLRKRKEKKKRELEEKQRQEVKEEGDSELMKNQHAEEQQALETAFDVEDKVTEDALQAIDKATEASKEDVVTTLSEVKRVLEEPDPDPSAILREFEAAKQKHDSMAKDETSARKDKLRKQLEARKKRRAAALKEKHEDDTEQLCKEGAADLTEEELKERHETDKAQLEGELAASEVALNQELAGLKNQVTEQKKRIEDLLEAERAQAIATAKSLQSMSDKEKQDLISTNEQMMTAMKAQFEAEKLAMQDQHIKELAAKLAAQESVFNDKSAEMDRKWQDREEEVTKQMGELKERLSGLEAQHQEELEKLARDLESKHQEEYIAFRKKVEESQTETLKASAQQKEEALRNAESEEERSRVMQDYEESSKRLQETLEHEKQVQMDAFKKKQAERKAKKLAEKEKQQSEQQEHLEDLHGEMGKGEQLRVEQEQEQHILDEQLKKEEEEALASIELESRAKAQKEQEAAAQKRAELEDKAKQQNMNGEDAARLMAEYAEQEKARSSHNEQDKVKHKEDLKRRMKEKRMKKQQEQQKVHEEELARQLAAEQALQERFAEKEAAADAEPAGEEAAEVAAAMEVDMAAIEAKEKEMKAEMDRREKELQEKQVQMQHDLEEEMVQKESEEMEKLRAQMDNQKMEQERLAKEAEEKARAEKDSTAASQILADAKKAQTRMEAQMKEERKVQQEKIRAKLKAKKAKKKAELSKQAVDEKTALRDDNMDEMRKAKGNAYFQAELDRIKLVLGDRGEPGYDKVTETVKEVIEPRQREEMMDLLAHQMRKQALLLSAAMGDIITLQRSKLAEAPAEEQMALEEQNTKEREKYEVMQRESIELQGEKEQQALREEQREQVLRFVSEVAPEYTDRLQDERQRLQMESEMERAKMHGEGDVEKRMEAMMGQLDNMKEEEIEKEIEKMEADMRNEERKEMSKMSKRLADISARKQHALAQLKKEQAAELAAAPNDGKRAMEQEHAEKLSQLTKALNEEEAKQQKAMEEKVAQRAEDRRRVRRLALEQKKEHEYKAKEEALRKQQEKAMADQQVVMSAKEKELDELRGRLDNTNKEKTSLMARSRFSALKQKHIQSAVKPKIDTTSMLEEQKKEEEQTRKVAEAVTEPLMQRMEQLEKMLRGSLGQAAQPQYHNAKDLQRIADPDITIPVTLRPDQLKPSQQNMFPFAKEYVDKLQAGGATLITDVVPASSLPHRDSNNAYGNSYQYDKKTGELHVHAEVLEDPGELQLILAHANAHVVSGKDDDTDPAFMREFHKSLMANMRSAAQDKAAGSPKKSAQEIAAKEATNLLQQSEKDQEVAEAKELQRRETKKVELERKRTEMRKKAGNLVKDNMKSRLEGKAVAQEKHKLRAQRNAVLKVFEQYDADKSGYVDAEEFHSVVVGLGANLTREETDIAFSTLDRNRDNKATFDEVFDWYVG